MTVTQSDFDALKAEIAELKKVVGFDILTGPQPSIPEWWTKFVPANELTSGEYPLGIAQKLTSFQIADRARLDALNALTERVRTLESKPSGSVSVPPTMPPAPAPPTGPTIPPLTAAEQAALAVALQRGVTNSAWLSQSLVDTIIADAAAGRYAICDAAVISAVKGWFYDETAGVTWADQQAMAKYLQEIIDQRDPDNRDVTMSPDDPRVKQVSSVAPAPSTGSVTPESVAAALRDGFDIHVAKDPATGRPYLAIGMTPDFENQSPFQLGPRVAGEIAAYQNTLGTPGGTEGSPEVGCNTFVIRDGDGGMRWRQYLKWGKNGKKRNTLNRPATILALDSMGDLCSSHEAVGATKDEGQSWYIVTSLGNKLARFVTFIPGWSPSIEKCSTNYGDADTKLL